MYALSAWLSDHESRRSEARDNDSSRVVDLVEDISRRKVVDSEVYQGQLLLLFLGLCTS